MTSVIVSEMLTATLSGIDFLTCKVSFSEIFWCWKWFFDTIQSVTSHFRENWNNISKKTILIIFNHRSYWSVLQIRKFYFLFCLRYFKVLFFILNFFKAKLGRGFEVILYIPSKCHTYGHFYFCGYIICVSWTWK